jgi:DNA primase
MTFSPQFLDELRDRARLASVIGRRVKLARKGREHLGLCPFHNEKTPSFTVNEEKGFYHCFGCGEHGSVIDFVMKADGLPFPEAVERLAADAGMEVPADSPEDRQRRAQQQPLYAVMESAAAFFEGTLRMPEGKAALAYLHGRGLDDTTIAAFRLGFAADSRGGLKSALGRQGIETETLVTAGLLIRPDEGDPYDRFRGRVMFPICDRRGKVIAFGGRRLDQVKPKYLNSPETPLFQKRRVLYGLALAAAPAHKEGRVIVTEGYTDVIALHRAGIRCAVAPLGTALTEEQVALLWRLAPEPVLCFDGDAAGRLAMARAAERALPLLKPGFGLRFAELPVDEDPDSLIQGGGTEAMERVIEGARPLSEVLWRMELGGRPVATPEARASMEERLRHHARRIEDPTVRAHFLSAFKDRLWKRFRQASAHPGQAPSAVIEADAGPGTVLDAVARREQVLLALFLKHPEIFDDMGEDLGAMELSSADNERLRQGVIDILIDSPGLDSASLEQRLAAAGLEQEVARVLGVSEVKAMIREGRPLSPGASPDDISGVWEDFVRFSSESHLDRDIEATLGALREEITEDAWDRALALLQSKEEYPEPR